MKIIKTAPILTIKKISLIRPKLKKVILAGGVFNIIHAGHIAHLKKAKSLGNTLIVHITGDKRVKTKKGKDRPFLSERERALIISSLRFIDYVFIYNGRHYDQRIINQIRPDILFFNKEAFNSKVKIAVNDLKNFNGKILVDNQRKINNSSNLLKILKKEPAVYGAGSKIKNY